MFLKKLEEAKAYDKKLISKKWDELEAGLRAQSDEKSAREIRCAFEDYYQEIFGKGDLAFWLANLYDAESGGFYYSNSARDNDGFLPDLESTRQAIRLLHVLGIPECYGETIGDLYPDDFKKKVIKFVKERQDENGYFYHPQWEKAFTDSKPHRRGRDLQWACQLLEWFGDSPTYDTPLGVKGNGVLADGRIAENYVQRDCSGIAAPKEELVTPQLLNKEAFLKYLSKFDLNKDPYVVSSCFESESRQIYARDLVLHNMGADYSLCDILSEWFTEKQDTKTGLWTFKSPDTEGTNGLLKAAGAFNGIHRPLPNPTKGIESCIEVINGNEPCHTVCYVLNPWYGINHILLNMRLYGEGDSAADKYKKYIFSRAPEMIEKTKVRIMDFKKPDGSFSMNKKCSSYTSQGHPVAIKDTDEGDVNATNIGTQGIIGHIFDLLNVPRIPVLGLADKMRFFEIIEEKTRQK